MEEKKQTLLKNKANLEYIKALIKTESSGNEYKCKVGGIKLGSHHAGYQSTLYSPQNGVPIKKSKGDSRGIIRLLEKRLGLGSWIDNI